MQNPSILPAPAARTRRDDGNGQKQRILSNSVIGEEEAMIIDGISPSQDHQHWGLSEPQPDENMQIMEGGNSRTGAVKGSFFFRCLQNIAAVAVGFGDSVVFFHPVSVRAVDLKLRWSLGRLPFEIL